jgi:hypothetical protein
MTYTFRFYGREKNSLGIGSEHTVTVCGMSQDEAYVRLYETHEHITHCVLVRIER